MQERDVERSLIAKINKKTKIISIELTTYCPLQCKYCSRQLIDRKNQEMPWEKFLSLLPKLKEFKRIIFCGMGEPMVYSHIYDAVDALKDKQITLITNGSVEINYKKLNANKNIEVIVFSVDCPTEQQMIEMTGNYKWENLLKNINSARRISKILNCTVTEENYQYVPKLVDLAVRNKLHGISFVTEMLKEKNSELHANIQSYIKEAEDKAKKQMLISSNSYDSLKCISFGDIVPFINLQGDIYPCCHGMESGIKVGNLFNNSFDEIWDSNEYATYKTGRMCMEECVLYKNKLLKGKGSM